MDKIRKLAELLHVLADNLVGYAHDTQARIVKEKDDYADKLRRIKRIINFGSRIDALGSRNKFCPLVPIQKAHLSRILNLEFIAEDETIDRIEAALKKAERK